MLVTFLAVVAIGPAVPLCVRHLVESLSGLACFCFLECGLPSGGFLVRSRSSVSVCGFLEEVCRAFALFAKWCLRALVRWLPG